MLLPDREHVVPLHIHHQLPPAQAEDFAPDLQDVTAIEGFDAEAVAGQGENALLQDQRFRLVGDVVPEDAEGLLGRSQLGHAVGEGGAVLLGVRICTVGFLMAGPDKLDGLVGSWGSVGWWAGVGGGRRKHFTFTQRQLGILGYAVERWACQTLAKEL